MDSDVRPMNHARFFEELLHELQVLIASGTEYDLIRSSRILRQLLLDGDALLHLVNRELRASPVFRVKSRYEGLPSSDWINTDLFWSEEGAPHADLNLQQFLSHSVGVSMGRQITVREVVKYAAIILGGVHFKVGKGGEYEGIAKFHDGRDREGLSPVLRSLQEIGAITRDALIPIRDLLINRERFESGKGWTALLCLEILPTPPDEDNYILDLGTNEAKNRFSIYLDSRGELTFRVVDRNGARKYLRAGRLGDAVPARRPIIIACEFSTVGTETLLSLRTDGWDHAEIVESPAYQEIGDPFHFVTGSDCRGKRHTHMFVYGELLIARPLTEIELTQAAQHFLTKAAESGVGLHYEGNQFMYSGGHPNFPEPGADCEPQHG